MKIRNLNTLTAASMALTVVGASANDNPFQMVEYGEGLTVAGEAVDMQGNKVMIDDETGFNYGGDDMGKYAGGKIGTGTKDPAVCGTFAGGSCSMPHVSAEATLKEAATGAAAEAADKATDAAGKMMDKAKEMMQ